MNKTIITVTTDGAYIETDMSTAKQLIKKNSRCNTTINEDSVELSYEESI